MKVLIVVPAYNEHENILKTIEDIKNNLGSFDYVVINDCSTDSTIEILELNNINHINLPVNLGLAGAVQTGYKYAMENNYDAVIQFDGDGQHQAKYIDDMLKEIENGNNIVIGSRFVTEKKPWSLRMIGSRILSFLIKIKTGVTIKDPTSGMRMLDKATAKDYAMHMNRKPEPDTLVYEIRSQKAKVKEIQVEMNERTAGVSLYGGLMNSARYMVKMIISIIFLN